MTGASPFSSEWILPGTDRASRHAECGEFATWGHGSAEDGAWHWRRARRGCGAFECPSDLATKGADDYRWRNAYTTRQARRIVARLGKRSQHGVLSPPGAHGGPCEPPKTAKEYRKLRETAYDVLRSVGVTRAGLFPHPFRCVQANRRGGHDGFHFHFQTPCRIDPLRVKLAYERTGWVTKGLGFKPTLRVAIYELHHVGRLGRVLTKGELAARAERRRARGLDPNPARKSNLRFETEAVTWFGDWKTALRIESEGILCPVCEEIVPVKGWTKLEWNGQGPPGPELSGVGGPWRAVARAW
jgi:hypothetical protein